MLKKMLLCCLLITFVASGDMLNDGYWQENTSGFRRMTDGCREGMNTGKQPVIFSRKLSNLVSGESYELSFCIRGNDLRAVSVGVAADEKGKKSFARQQLPLDSKEYLPVRRIFTAQKENWLVIRIAPGTEKFFISKLEVSPVKKAHADLRLCVFSDVQPPRNGELKRKGSQLWYADQVYKRAKLLGVDAYLIAGDIGNLSDEVTYQEFRALFDSHHGKDQQPPVWLPVMGNHDFWKDKHGRNSFPVAESIEKFKRYLKIDSVNPHIVLNGYDIIGFSIEGGMYTSGRLVAQVEKEIRKAVARDPQKPIFLFAHNHAYGTVRDSNENRNLADMLKKYPQVIYFSGHTHRAVEDEKSIHQEDFTSIGTGALTYTAPVAYRRSVEYPNRSHYGNMLYLEVRKDEIIIRRFQLNDGREIMDNGKPWRLQLPLRKETFSYVLSKRLAENKPPVFPAGATLAARAVFNQKGEFTGVELQGTAARHSNIIRLYSVKISKKNTDGSWSPVSAVANRGKGREQNIEKYPLTFVSDFYLPLESQKNTFSTFIRRYPLPLYMGCDFQPGMTYRFEVRAIDSLDQESQSVLCTDLAIPDKKGDNTGRK
jgi:predicted phosphodiesterase